jgi:hypothetical protein
MDGWIVDGEEAKVPAAGAGEEAEGAGKIVAETLWVDEGAQAVDFNAPWKLRTGPWDRSKTASSSVNCCWTKKLQSSLVFAMLLPITGLSLTILS